MKHLKKFLAIVTVLTLFLAPILSTPMTANATEATTIYVKYVESLSQFRFQKNTWKDGQEHWALSFLDSTIKDGDHLVIDGTNGQGINLTVNVRLNSLTIVNGNVAIITANYVDNFYGLANTASAINADIANANVYGNAVVNFNNNVKVLNLYKSSSAASQNINVLGTCDELHIENSSNAYSFQKDTLRIKNGKIATDIKYFSSTAPTTPSTSDDEYDDVPKTGDYGFNPLWLIAFAGICFAGSFGIKKMK